MKAEKDTEQRSNHIGNSEPRSNNYAKWAYNDHNYSGDQDVNYALAMAAGSESNGFNINEVLNNEGLNAEIKKLIAEQGNY